MDWALFAGQCHCTRPRSVRSARTMFLQLAMDVWQWLVSSSETTTQSGEVCAQGCLRLFIDETQKNVKNEIWIYLNQGGFRCPLLDLTIVFLESSLMGNGGSPEFNDSAAIWLHISRCLKAGYITCFKIAEETLSIPSFQAGNMLDSCLHPNPVRLQLKLNLSTLEEIRKVWPFGVYLHCVNVSEHAISSFGAEGDPSVPQKWHKARQRG